MLFNQDKKKLCFVWEVAWGSLSMLGCRRPAKGYITDMKEKPVNTALQLKEKERKVVVLKSAIIRFVPKVFWYSTREWVQVQEEQRKVVFQRLPTEGNEGVKMVLVGVGSKNLQLHVTKHCWGNVNGGVRGCWKLILLMSSLTLRVSLISGSSSAACFLKRSLFSPNLQAHHTCTPSKFQNYY